MERPCVAWCINPDAVFCDRIPVVGPDTVLHEPGSGIRPRPLLHHAAKSYGLRTALPSRRTTVGALMAAVTSLRTSPAAISPGCLRPSVRGS